jgi:hypothetical protein
MFKYFVILIIFISITIFFIPNNSTSEYNIHIIPEKYFIKNEKLNELIDNLGIEVFDDEVGYQEKYNLNKIDSYSQHGVKNTNYSKYDDVILHYCCDKNSPIVSGNKQGVTVIETEENNLKLFRVFYTFDIFEQTENCIAADDEISSKFEKKYGKISYFKYKNKYLSISIVPFEPVNCALNADQDIKLPNMVYVYNITDYTPLIVNIEKKKNLNPVKNY